MTLIDRFPRITIALAFTLYALAVLHIAFGQSIHLY